VIILQQIRHAMLKIILIPLVAGITILFSGCASKATMENMVYKPATHQQY